MNDDAYTLTEAERLALVKVILSHGPSGLVNSREGWVECLCGERLHLPSGLTFDGYAEMMDEEDRARAEHLANHIAAAEQRGREEVLAADHKGCGVCADHARVAALIERSSLGSAEAKAVRESVPNDIGIALATAARHLSRAEAAEAARDAANDRADRVLAAVEALAVNDCAGCFEPGHPCGDPVCDLRDHIRAILAQHPTPEAGEQP